MGATKTCRICCQTQAIENFGQDATGQFHHTCNGCTKGRGAAPIVIVCPACGNHESRARAPKDGLCRKCHSLEMEMDYARKWWSTHPDWVIDNAENK